MTAETTPLMSIRPEFASKILNGEKSVEFRRRPVRVEAGQPVVLYSSSPEMALRGVVWVQEVVVGTPESLWRRYSTDGGIDERRFRAYFDGTVEGCALVLSHFLPLDRTVSLRELRERLPGFHPPQFYRRLTAANLAVLGLAWLVTSLKR